MIPQGSAGSGLLLGSKPLHPFPSEMGRFNPAARNVSLPHSYGSVLLPQGTDPPQGAGGILQGPLPAATAHPLVWIWFSEELMRLMEGRALQQEASASTSQPVICVGFINGERRDLVFVLGRYMNLIPSGSPVGSSKRSCFMVGFYL